MCSKGIISVVLQLLPNVSALLSHTHSFVRGCVGECHVLLPLYTEPTSILDLFLYLDPTNLNICFEIFARFRADSLVTFNILPNKNIRIAANLLVILTDNA